MGLSHRTHVFFILIDNKSLVEETHDFGVPFSWTIVFIDEYTLRSILVDYKKSWRNYKKSLNTVQELRFGRQLDLVDQKASQQG